MSILTFESRVPEDDVKAQAEKAMLGNGDFPSLTACRERLEKNYLIRLMEKARGHRKTACRLSGVSQVRLYALLGKYNLPGFTSFQ